MWGFPASDNEETNMRVKPYPDRDDGMRVWLHPDEVDALLEEVSTGDDSIRRQIAVLLASRVGLRRSEVVGIRPSDLVKTRAGPALRVRASVAKNDRRRTPPIPDQLRDYIRAFADGRVDDDEPVVGRTGRTVYNWVTDAAADLGESTGNRDWELVDVHDLRRTWATALLEDGVNPVVVMDWGGWQSWSTFRDHYLGEFSPRALERERGKVPYLGGDVDVDDREIVAVPQGATRHAGAD
jgi:integrase